MIDFDQPVNAPVRHINDTNVRVNGRERVVRRLGACRREGVKDRGFTDVRQTDDAAIKTHEELLF
jgi:hypothetical protein